MRYKCDICGAEYAREEECTSCEAGHGHECSMAYEVVGRVIACKCSQCDRTAGEGLV